MDIFGKIFETMEKTTKKVISVSENVVGVTKLRISISQAESKLNGLFERIGVLVYDAYRNDTSVPEEVTQKCHEIDELYGEIEAIKLELAQLKKMKVCPSCDKENDADASYCSTCGYRFDSDPEETIDVTPEE